MYSYLITSSSCSLSENDDQVECHTCFKADSTVYTHVAGGGALLSCGQLAEIRNAEVVANAAANSNRFYAILGGALGTAAFLVLVFCCVRFFLVSASSSSSSRRRSARRAAENAAAGGGIGQGLVDDGDPALRRSGVGLPYPHFLNSELPPAYKDVVAMTVVLPIDPGNPPTIQTDGTASGRLLPPTMPSLPNSVPQMQSPPPSMIPMSPASAPLEIGEKTINDDNEASDDPPPPSYQEVIAFSPSAADMHQRIMAASIETAGSIQGAQERQSPSA
ncbi:unnamed protein product [Hymenolepis diminuta]|uniref:Uncharacterized protein n=1 Tax=Hymenolepis diminuta TaxID=6216 RepID=A0A564Y8I7_HYMDI|nr:unnamed protein product [Hymenolepis diminuta]